MNLHSQYKGTKNILMPIGYEYSKLELQQYENVNSVKYRERLEDICKDLYRSTGIKYYSITIKNRFSTLLCLSNMPHWAITYRRFQLHRCDMAISPELFKNKEVMFSIDLCQDPLMELFYNWFEAHGIFETYTIKRTFPEIELIVIAHHDKRIINPRQEYTKTLSALEQFTLIFLKEFQDLFNSECLSLQGAKFLTDIEYQKQIITREVILDEPTLSRRQKEILIYLVQGLTAKEIGRIINIEYRSVEKYIENMKRKLAAKNVTHAAALAIQLKLI